MISTFLYHFNSKAINHYKIFSVQQQDDRFGDFWFVNEVLDLCRLRKVFSFER